VESGVIELVLIRYSLQEKSVFMPTCRGRFSVSRSFVIDGCLG
jgi:hypothetical protein